jgi:hypothetical protein
MMSWAFPLGCMLAAWVAGNLAGWALYHQHHGGRHNWRIYLGPWAYDPWVHSSGSQCEQWC